MYLKDPISDVNGKSNKRFKINRTLSSVKKSLRHSIFYDTYCSTRSLVPLDWWVLTPKTESCERRGDTINQRRGTTIVKIGRNPPPKRIQTTPSSRIDKTLLHEKEGMKIEFQVTNKKKTGTGREERGEKTWL